MYMLAKRALLNDLLRDFTPGFYARSAHDLFQNDQPAPSDLRTDVQEDANAYTLHIELAGVKKEDVQVSIDSNVITLRAEIKREGSGVNGTNGDSADRAERLLQRERQYGSVSRRFLLPGEVDEANARAKMENGMLMLSLPKKAPASARRLTIE